MIKAELQKIIDLEKNKPYRNSVTISELRAKYIEEHNELPTEAYMFPNLV